MRLLSLTRREFVCIGAAALAERATIAAPPQRAAKGGGVSLPFSITVTEEKIANTPDYMSEHNNPGFMDFPYCPVMIDGEYWVIYKNGYFDPVYRFRGTNIEDAVRQEDGRAATPKGAYILGGIWYNASEKKLYAPLHYEVEQFPGGVFREVHLATSTDTGMNWKYEGPLLTTIDPNGTQKRSDSSGPNFQGGDGDQMLFVDEPGGFHYLFTSHYLWSKDPSLTPSFLRHCVARCAIADKMSPGKWRRFYEGAWDQPGLTGKASYVNGFCVTYNKYLKTYLSFNPFGGISTCDDLSKQNWSPSFRLGDFWGSGDEWGYWATDSEKKDTNRSGKQLFVYGSWHLKPEREFQVVLGPGETEPELGYLPPAICLTKSFALLNVATMDPSQLYGYNAVPESSDPIEARMTRIIASSSAEAKYSGAWTDALDPTYFQGKAKSSAKKGAGVEFVFKGSDIYWRAVKAPDRGKADVFIDGRLQTTVDCWASAPLVYQFAFVKQGVSGNRPHIIKIVVKDEKNRRSTGTAITHMLFEESLEAGSGAPLAGVQS